MNVILAKSAGFCWGVRRAVETALASAARNATAASAPPARRPVFTDGPLIHNAHQTRLLEESGVKEAEDLGALAQGSTLLIRAHGISPERRQFLESLSLDLVDATCPDVAKIHRVIEARAASGALALVYGDAGHAEVAGLLGCAGARGRVVTSPQDVEALPRQEAPVCLVAQSTQSPESFAEIADAVKRRFPGAEIIDTICRATKMRQSELRELAAKCDAIVVIGSPKSANTQRLAQIASSLKQTILIDSADDLRMRDFAGFATVAVTAGASTPDFIINAVVEKLGNA